MSTILSKVTITVEYDDLLVSPMFMLDHLIELEGVISVSDIEDTDIPLVDQAEYDPHGGGKHRYYEEN